MMTLLFFHSLFRWLVLISLLSSIFIAYRGYYQQLPFSKSANALRHWTATIAHIQLMLGILVYSKSQVVSYFWKHFSQAVHQLDTLFFSLIHLVLMLVAIVLLTIGSALAKRRESDREKFKAMLVWFTLVLCIIFLAIPWPFSPLANRPYLRHF